MSGRLPRRLAARAHDVTLLGLATGPEEPVESHSEGVRIVRVSTGASRLPMIYSDPKRPNALPAARSAGEPGDPKRTLPQPFRCGTRTQLDRQQCPGPHRARRSAARPDAARLQPYLRDQAIHGARETAGAPGRLPAVACLVRQSHYGASPARSLSRPTRGPRAAERTTLPISRPSAVRLPARRRRRRRLARGCRPERGGHSEFHPR